MSLLPRSQRLLFLSSRLAFRVSTISFRGISGSEAKVEEAKVKEENPFRLPHHHPSSFDKRLLVHFRYYPNYESVPGRVHGSVMEVAKSKARIKISMLIMLSTVLGCGYMMWYGRKHAKNYSLLDHNALRHQQYKEAEGGKGMAMGHRGLMGDKSEVMQTVILKNELAEAKKKIEELEKNP